MIVSTRMKTREIMFQVLIGILTINERQERKGTPILVSSPYRYSNNTVSVTDAVAVCPVSSPYRYSNNNKI